MAILVLNFPTNQFDTASESICMKLTNYLRLALCLSLLAASASAFGQDALSVVPPRPPASSFPFQVRPGAAGLEVTAYTGTDGLLRRGDIISWVSTPESNDNGVQVNSAAELQTEVLSRLNRQGEIALWTTRGNAEPDWVIVTVEKREFSPPRPPIGPPTRPVGPPTGPPMRPIGPPTAPPPEPLGPPTAPPPESGEGYNELPKELGGMSLTPGCYVSNTVPGRHGETWGAIEMPGNTGIQYSIWPVREGNGPRTSGDFVSDAARLAEENRQWYREHYIADNLVQLALSNEGQLMVSYPGRGINMSVHIDGPIQLADALLIMLSVPNKERNMDWQDAVTMIQEGNVKSVTQYHSRQVRINMGSGQTYRTNEPNIDDVFDVLKQCGKYESVGIITE